MGEPALRLYSGEQQHFTRSEAPEAAWTLQRWWDDTVRPAMLAEGKSQARIGDYETYLKRWDRWCSHHRTIYPVLCDINPATLTEFRTWLISSEKITKSQSDKHLQGISTLLKRAVDAWIIPRLAKLSACGKKGEAVKFVFSAEEINSLYAACADVQWPAKFADGRSCQNAAEYWRTYLVGGWNYGFRPQEWWSYEGSANALTWDGVHWDPEFEVEGRMVTNESGWTTWTQDKTGHVVVLPMNVTLHRYLRGLWDLLPKTRQRPDRRVWDFPMSAGTAKPKQKLTPASGFYAAWWDIVKRAGITPKTKADSRGRVKMLTHCPSHFRKTAHTLHRDRIGNAANWITGHSGKTIGEKHYYNAVKKVIESVASLPQPSCFT